MKIKNYTLFKESNKDYSIIDFYYDLHHYYDKNIDLEYYSEIFLGKGIYKRISDFVDSMIEKFEGIHTEDIESKLTEITDYIDSDLKYNVSFVILYSNWKDSEKEAEVKFNGALFLKKNPELEKERIIKDIIRSIIYPTIEVFFSNTSFYIRKTKEEIYVLDEKYNCKNFDIRNFDIFNTKEFNKISKYTNLEEYNIDRFFKCYVPSVYIEFDSNTVFDVLQDFEEKLDNSLPRIFSLIPHEKFIWDRSRFSRKFNEKNKISNYIVKVILK